MKHYDKINNAVGWLVFAVAAFTYCMTIEPTASFWDCPEFITTGYKLEVGHPPGAPFFMLTANLFQPVCKRPLASGKDGEHHERTDERSLHPVSVLEHHMPCKKTGMSER